MALPPSPFYVLVHGEEHRKGGSSRAQTQKEALAQNSTASEAILKVIIQALLTGCGILQLTKFPVGY